MFFKILNDFIGSKKIYVVWSTIQSILSKHSMYIKHLPNPFERTDALIDGKHLRVFHLVIPCYCLAWKTLYLVDREKGDFCERLSTHIYFKRDATSTTFLQQFYNKSQVVSCYWFKFETNTKITFLP